MKSDKYSKDHWLSGYDGGGGNPWDQYNPFKKGISTEKRKELRAKRNKKNKSKK